MGCEADVDCESFERWTGETGTGNNLSEFWASVESEISG